MTLFSRLFSKKPKTQATDEPEPVQEQKPAMQKTENKPAAEEPPDTIKQRPAAKKTPISSGAERPNKSRPTGEAGEVKETVPWRTFSIFISSTFADMQAERDHLKNVVFPKVEVELQKRRIKLEIVDLRWGVDTTSMEQEHEREANVLKVCLDEIKRCRPFFIGLLGDRYGWVPPEKRMADAVVGEGLKVSLKDKSVTDLEIEFGVLASREQLVRSAFYFREALPYDKFTPKRAKLFSDEYNPEQTEKEKAERKASLETLKAKIRLHFEAIKHPEKVKNYSATWDAEKEKVTALDDFGDRVYDDILAECEAHAAETWNEVPKNWQEQELALLDAFIDQHTHVTTFITDKGEERVPTFCGRKPLLEALKRHLLSDDAGQWGLVLTGESGSGKSAVFSMVHKMMEKKECLILTHAAGLSPRAKRVADLLKIWNNLMREDLGMEQVMEDTSPPTPLLKETTSPPTPLLKERGEGEKAETPIEQLQQQFAELLSVVANKKRVVLLIDALDRFEPTGRAQAMSWLPALMPRNVRLLITAIAGTEKEAVKYHRGLHTKSIDLFTSEEAAEMLNTLGLRNHKTLPAGIAKLILDKQIPCGQPAASSPLWLSLAVNILMAIDQDDFEQMSKLEGRGDQQIETYLTSLAQGFDPLPGKLFLNLVDKAGQLFGRDFTSAVFDYIAISRNGLREKDLESLLPIHGIEWDPLRYAMLRRWFKAHLVMQGEELQWNLTHSILRNTLRNENKVKAERIHQCLASHFLTLIPGDTLRNTETMLHLLESGNLEQAAMYYSNELTPEEKTGATNILAETATSGKEGLKKVTELPKLVQNNVEIFKSLYIKYIYDLNDALSIEMNLNERLTLLNYFIEKFQNTDIKIHKKDFWWMHLYISLNARFGCIQQDMGNKEEAIKFFEMSIELAKEFNNEYPDIWLSKHNSAVCYGMLGNLHKEMRNFEKALKNFESYLQIHQELFSSYPCDDMKYGLALSYEKLGEINQALGYNEEALSYYEKDMNLSKELYAVYPSNDLFKHGLAISYSKLGDIYEALGEYEKAMHFYILDISLSEELYEANPNNLSFKYDFATVNGKLGSINKKMRHLDEALKYYENHVHLLVENNNINLSNKYKSALYVSYGKIGSIYQSLGRFEEALKYFAKYNQLAQELCDVTPSDSDFKGELAISCVKLGEVHQALYHISESHNYYEQYYEIMKERFIVNSNLVELLESVAMRSYKLALLYKQINDDQKGELYWKEWKTCTSHLVQNFPAIQKYMDWNNSEY